MFNGNVLLAFFLVAFCCGRPAKAANETPNIIVMLMDDMGWGDLGIFGNPSGGSPNLDKMGRDGMVLTDAYAANPLCSPFICLVNQEL